MKAKIVLTLLLSYLALSSVDAALPRCLSYVRRKAPCLDRPYVLVTATDTIYCCKWKKLRPGLEGYEMSGEGIMERVCKCYPPKLSMVKCKRNNKLDKVTADIDKLPDHARMFKAVKSLNRKMSENPKIFDADGKFITNKDEIQTFIGKHFKDKFRDYQINDLETFQGDAGDRNNELEKDLARFNNNRACGEDGIPGELIKYGADTLAKVICNILNRVFSEHDDININGGKVITLQKPVKAKGPVTNLRPITLLNTLRKVLSLIVLNRTKHDINEYLDFFITGIDTIDRHLLLNIMKNIIKEDEQRIIRYLLSNRAKSIKLKGSSKTESFKSNIGTPQADSLSPVLFIVYSEHALKNMRKIETLYTQNT
ncbi:very-long-chain enoyl-CoA reductase [Elysia marginata]|uniref:Very-long-chain enoyl-CoA reductase n=1 Tax=Elysia marginata TaxID=1093978 RepID=A0AAV4FYX4_9GAST|nr:very-long-chain enoyl-CoA reductase [Elysia marginata]